MAENNLEQLWAEEAEQEKAARMEDLAEVNDDSEEYIEDEENPDKDSRHLGAIGSSKPKSDEEEITEGGQTPVVAESEARANMEDRVDKLEAAVCNMATWQPVASDIISGNRDLIMQLSARIEYLETALNQMRLAHRENGEVKEGEIKEDKESVKKAGRTYVKIMREGEDEEDMAEVPTNSQGLLPQATVLALFPATTAIKFRVSTSSGGKTWRALLLEDDLYHPPGDTGWGDRVYTCTQPQKTPTVTQSRSEAGASSLMDPGPLPFSMGSLTPASSSLAGVNNFYGGE